MFVPAPKEEVYILPILVTRTNVLLAVITSEYVVILWLYTPLIYILMSVKDNGLSIGEV